MIDLVADFLPVIAAAGLIAFAATPFTLLLARRVGFLDRPSTRKFHRAPMPLLGGLAIYLGLVAGLIVFGPDEPLRELLGILGGATLIGALGLWDDRFGMHPRLKLLGQALAGVLLVVGGVQTHLFNNWLDVPLTVVWVIGICNAINFLDNMDGLAAGLAAVASAFFLLLAIVNAQTLVAGLAAAALGACLGFLFYNFSPAISFMGDAGSLVLGFVLALLGIKLQFTGRPPLSTWMIPVVVLAVPIFDTTLVVWSRLRRRVPVDQGGTDHLSHRLVRLGMSPRRAVVALWGVSAAMGVVAIWMSRSSVLVSNSLLGVLVAAGLSALVILEKAQALPTPARRLGLKPDLRVTVIASGAHLAAAIEAAAQLSPEVRALLTPVNAGEANERAWSQVSRRDFAAAVVALARRPDAVGEFVANGRYGSAGEAAPFDLWSNAQAASAAFQLQGSLIATLDGKGTPDPAALEAIRGTDLILLYSGEPGDNLLPTLAVPGVADLLRRSKRPRVLVSRRPAEVLAAIGAAAGQRMVTHVLAPDPVAELPEPCPFYVVPELDDAVALGDALAEVWLERNRAWLRRKGRQDG